MSTTMAKPHIVVIGAGIIGIQSAIHLQEAGYDVTILAKHFPGDESIEYTSPWAGAQWRSHGTAAAEDEELRGWEKEGYDAWAEIVDRGGGAEEGIAALPTTIYWTAPTPEIQPSPSSLWFAPHVRAFSVLSDGQLASDAHAAIQFTSFAINVPKYLSYLLTRFHEAGGKSIRHTLNTSHGLSPALEEAAAAAAKEIIPPTSELGKDEGSGRASIEIAAFVNATGIGAKALVGDESVYPTRGQTVLVRGEAPAMRSRIFGDEEGISYVIPRPGSGTTVLGGVKEAGRWDEKPDEQTTKSILARCRDLAPELLTKQGERETGFEVLGVQVGLRPSRVGGARVELERLVEKKAKVVHCYGHSGTGYQSSVGTARKVVRLVNES